MAPPDSSGKTERRAALARIREEVELIRRTTVRDLADLARDRATTSVTEQNERLSWRASARREVHSLLADFKKHRHAVADLRREAVHTFLGELRAASDSRSLSASTPAEAPRLVPPAAPPARLPQASKPGPERAPRWQPSGKRYWTPSAKTAPAKAPVARAPVQAPVMPAPVQAQVTPAPVQAPPTPPPVPAAAPPSSAAPAVAPPAPTLSVAPSAAPPRRYDDLTLIDGIGSGIQRRLNDAGINTWADLAASSGEELRQILGIQLAFASWIDQAKARTAEAA